MESWWGWAEETWVFLGVSPKVRCHNKGVDDSSVRCSNLVVEWQLPLYVDKRADLLNNLGYTHGVCKDYHEVHSVLQMMLMPLLVFSVVGVAAVTVADPAVSVSLFPAAGVQDALLSPSAASAGLEESLPWEEVAAFGKLSVEDVIRRVTRAAQAAAKER